MTLSTLPVGKHSLLATWLAVWTLTGAACWLVVVGVQDLSRTHALITDVRSAQATMVGPALIGVVGAMFVAERIWPAMSRPAHARAHRVDAGYLAIYVAVGPLVTLLNTGFSVMVGRYASFLELGKLALLPRTFTSVLILVGIDGMNWAAHTANHRRPTFWRFHALHHSQEDMSVLTTFRTHPLSHASYLPAVLPALVLEASGTVPAALLVLYGCLVTLPHANLRWTYGVLGRWVVSPAFHRLHHASTPVTGAHAVNFGFVLTVWDRLARTAVLPGKGAPVPTGIAGRPVPVEQEDAGRTLWRTVAAQLIQPLRLESGLEGRS